MPALKGSRCYLCGAMGFAPDGGVVWRERIKEDLIDLGIQWLDPTNKPAGFPDETNEIRAYWQRLKEAGLFEEFGSEMREIRKLDIRMVDVSDFLIVNIDTSIHACGTYEECFRALSQKKPVVVHVEQGKKNAPDWLFAALDHRQIFSHWLDLNEYLRYIDNTQTIYGRWITFNI